MRILITGVSTRAIAESALAAGYDFLTLDYFGDADQKSWCENYSLKRDFGLPFGSVELYESSRGLNFDSVVYLSDLENHPEIVGRFGKEHREGKRIHLLGNGAAVLNRVRHWPTFFSFLRQQEIPAPTTIFAGHASHPSGDLWQREWLRKPVRSGGGHGIAFWPADRPAGKGFILKEHIEGRPCSASFVANGRECVVLGVDRLVGQAEFGAGAFYYCGNILPLAVEEEARLTMLVQVRHIIHSLTREFGLVGVNGLDFVFDAERGQVYPLEVNPRYSASMELIEQAYNLSIFDLHVRSITRKALPDFDLASAGWKSLPRFYGKSILYAERDGQAPDTRGWPTRGIRDVPFPGDDLARGGPICTILASASTRDNCFATLVAQAKTLKGEIYA